MSEAAKNTPNPVESSDTDPIETREWLDALDAVIQREGRERAHYLMEQLLDTARRQFGDMPFSATTAYVNTIPPALEVRSPGNHEYEERIRSFIRWNAMAMVVRANKHETPDGGSLGGHIASFASVATMIGAGMNHFWHAPHEGHGGDLIYFQGHSSPGLYSRAFIEGRLTEDQLNSFRQEVDGHGLPSYPHPKLMPDFWQFPTVSMGLGPLMAIYQARFLKYLHARGLANTANRKVWVFCGDGEMDEPESLGAIGLAAREKLDNLIFVINCNLQRLDGPVRGNGKIIQELEAFFKGAGWNVIKVIWGRGWDQLLASDKDDALVHLMNETLDGDYQTFKANDGAYIREHFFGRDPRTKAMVQNWTDDQIWALQRGGHDYRKVYAAYKAAMEHTGQPTVILAHTIKGYALGSHFAGRNSTHQMKKLTLEDAKQLRDRLQIPITDEELERDPYMPPYYMPPADHPALLYMKELREKLGGWVPERRDHQPKLPGLPTKPFEALSKGSGKLEVATTMALVRLIKDLIKDKNVGKYFVPIIPDEARTFGLDAIFPSAKIFNTTGQAYTPVDADMMLSYRESEQGQVLHTGITEAGSAAAFQVVGTAYATHNLPMVPFYIFYSMFGFQRTGDQFWAAGDQLSKGFVIGATAGRTTLTGEGLQHMDGNSQVLAATNHAFVCYDPAYAYELRHIMSDGLERMYGDAGGRDPNVMYYLTVYNEPIHQPAEPENLDVNGLIKGIYRLDDHQNFGGPKAQLLASGVGVPWAREARELLARDWGVDAAVWSVTSWTELRREALEAEEFNFLHPNEPQRTPFVSSQLQGTEGPFVASSDFDRMLPDQIRQWVPGDYQVLGADGFGFSDTRRAARRWFHIDAESMTVRVLKALADRGQIDRSLVQEAIDRYQLFNYSISGNDHAGDE